MASKTPTYGKNLPGNLGTEDVLRAIYDKIGSGSPSVVIEEKLDTIISLTGDVNNNIQINTEAVKENTQAIKDISINVDGSGICDRIDNVNNSVKNLDNNVKDGFDRTINAIKEYQPKPKPFPPCPPHPHPHPQPCPPIPRPNYECVHHYCPNDNYFHNMCIQSNPNLTREQKAYLEEVYRYERKFDPKEYYALPQYVPHPYMNIVRDVYNNMIYNLDNSL